MTYSNDSVTTALGVLIACYPQFRFFRAPIGYRGQRWVAERIDGTRPGLHTVITADLSELRTALSGDRTSHVR